MPPSVHSAWLPSRHHAPHNPSNRRIRTRMSGGVGGEASRDAPLSRFAARKTWMAAQTSAGMTIQRLRTGITSISCDPQARAHGACRHVFRGSAGESPASIVAPAKTDRLHAKTVRNPLAATVQPTGQALLFL